MNSSTVKLGDICDLQNGFAFKSTDYVDSSSVLNCRMSNIRPDGQFDIFYHAKYLPENFVEKYKDFLLKDGDVIIAMTDLAGEPKILGVPTIVKTHGKSILLNQRVGKLVFKKEAAVTIEYLKYALSRPDVKRYYRKFASGGLQINLGKKDLLSISIPLPSTEEQIRIAAILDKANLIKHKREQAIAKLDELADSVFMELSNSPEFASFPTVKLGSILELQRGASPRPISSWMDDSDDGVNWIKIADATASDKYIYKCKEKIKPEAVVHSRFVKEGDFLLSNSMSFGRPYILRTSGCIHDGWLVLRDKNNLFVQDYLYSMLCSPIVKNQFKKFATGAVVKNLNIEAVSKVQVRLPDKATQEKFSKRIGALEKQKEIYRNSLSAMTHLIKSLQHQAFTTGLNA